MTFGVTSTGFVAKSIQDLLDEIQQAQKAALGAAINTQADSVLGQLNGIMADQLAELWEVTNAIYRARQADSASDEALDNVAALTGATRLAATQSTLPLHASNSLLRLNTLLEGSMGALAVGQTVSIGANGERWTTDAASGNANPQPALVELAYTAVNTGKVQATPNSVDTIQTPVTGWTVKAAISTAGPQTFPLVDLQDLLVSIDGGSDQTIVFNTADFASIGAATSAEVSTAISTALTGGDAARDATGHVLMWSDTNGTGSSIQVNGGTAYEGLGFPRGLAQGFNRDIPAVVLCGNAEPYALSDSETLAVKVDGGGDQIVTFLTADFTSIGAATAVEVARVITRDLPGAVAYDNAGKVQIESLLTGVSSELKVTGGTANTALNFSLTEVSGFTGNAVLGRDLETDPELRLRREQLIRLSGASTLEAIRSALFATLNVSNAFIFENITDFTDADGLPPHSFEAVVQGGLAADVAQTLFDQKPVGIETYRDPGPDGRTEIVVDSQGISVDINFTRPTEIRMYIEIDIDMSPDDYGGGDTSAGDEQVKEALDAFGDALTIGDDVIINQFLCAAIHVPGLVDVTGLKIEDTFPPTNTSNIVIGGRDIATFSIADIVVNATAV